MSDFPRDVAMVPGAGTLGRSLHESQRIACNTTVRAISTVLILLASVLVLAGPAPVHAVTLRDSTLRVDLLVSGLSSPTTMAFIGPNDLLVLQKNDGRIRRVTNGVLQPNAVLDLAVDFASERGLLGIAVHPNFPTTPFVYLYLSESSTGRDTAGSPPPLGNRLYRYTWNGSSLVSPVLLASLPTPVPNHNGGVILFGPDGKLYIVIGDLNRTGQLQNIDTGPAPDDAGVILRLNDDGSVPFDNPFAALGGNLAKYYAYGIRNSFGMAFDPVTGKLWMTENGPENYDEINLVEPGFNSGWNRIMGPAARNPQGTSGLVLFPGSHYADPKFSWLDTVAPTGIVFLSSSALGAAYTNHLFVGDINNGVLYHFVPNCARNGFVFNGAGLADLVADSPTELDETIIGTGFDGITDLKVGPDGRLYVLSFNLGLIFVISSATPGAASLTVPSCTVTAGGGMDVAWTGIATPTSTDWIGLYTPGAPDTAFLAWSYVGCTQTPGAGRAAGACPFVIPDGLSPGTYELRLLSNNVFTRLATTAPFTVTSTGPLLSVSPGSISARGSVTATWSGIAAPTSTDWIGLYAPGTVDTAFLAWTYVSCTQTPSGARAAGACSFVIPDGLSPGTYELRLLSNNVFTRLATTGVLTVLTMTPATALTRSADIVTAGGGMDVAWTGIATPTSTDWIGLYTPDAPDTAFLAWRYVGCTQTPGAARAAGACPFVIPAGLSPSTYELRLLSNNVFTRLATSAPFKVTATGSLLSVSPGAVNAGGAVTATWSGIAVPTSTDWIGLYTPGAADTVFLAWTYVSCTQTPGSATAAGACALVIPPGLVPGVYELRLLANNVFTRLTTSGALIVGP